MRSSFIRAAAPLRSCLTPWHCSNEAVAPASHIKQTHSAHPIFMSQPSTIFTLLLTRSPIRISTLQHIFKRRFSTQTTNHDTNKPPPKNPSFGAASFKELGATSTVKIVVYVCISILATVETFTWSKLLWAKFGPAKKNENGEAER